VIEIKDKTTCQEFRTVRLWVKKQKINKTCESHALTCTTTGGCLRDLDYDNCFNQHSDRALQCKCGYMLYLFVKKQLGIITLYNRKFEKVVLTSIYCYQCAPVLDSVCFNKSAVWHTRQCTIKLPSSKYPSIHPLFLTVSISP